MCWMLNDGRLSSLTKTPSHKQIFTKKTKKKRKKIKHVLLKSAQHLKVTETIINLNNAIWPFSIFSLRLCLLPDVYCSIWLGCSSRVLCLSLGSSAPSFCYTDCTACWIIIPIVQCVVPWPLYISSFILLYCPSKIQLVHLDGLPLEYRHCLPLLLLGYSVVQMPFLPPGPNHCIA